MSRLKINTDLKQLDAPSLADQSHLADLYPTKKTTDEIIQDDQRRQELFTARLSKYSRFKAAVYGSLIFGAAIFFLQSLEGMWTASGGSTLGTLAGVSFSFAGSLLLYYVAYLWVKYINNVFYARAKTNKVFWTWYGMSIGVTIIVWLSGLLFPTDSRVWVLVAIAFHFIVVMASSHYATKNSGVAL